jgi:hypothetical protein
MKLKKLLVVKEVSVQPGNNMSIEPKDPSKKHFRISLIKSGIRMCGCIALIGYSSTNLFAVAFLVAEVLGVVEEL